MHKFNAKAKDGVHNMLADLYANADPDQTDKVAEHLPEVVPKQTPPKTGSQLLHEASEPVLPTHCSALQAAGELIIV